MTWIWILISALVAAAAVRHRGRVHAARAGAAPPPVDDDALRRILEDGTLPTSEEEPLDMDEASRAEEEFWEQPWDEPEEYS